MLASKTAIQKSMNCVWQIWNFKNNINDDYGLISLSFKCSRSIILNSSSYFHWQVLTKILTVLGSKWNSPKKLRTFKTHTMFNITFYSKNNSWKRLPEANLDPFARPHKWQPGYGWGDRWGCEVGLRHPSLCREGARRSEAARPTAHTGRKAEIENVLKLKKTLYTG